MIIVHQILVTDLLKYLEGLLLPTIYNTVMIGNHAPESEI